MPTLCYFETLKPCQYGVADYGRPSLESDCGAAATVRWTWDGGKSWLYLCPEHARKVEEAEDADAPA